VPHRVGSRRQYAKVADFSHEVPHRGPALPGSSPSPAPAPAAAVPANPPPSGSSPASGAAAAAPPSRREPTF
jgi:hypothetical protein